MTDPLSWSAPPETHFSEASEAAARLITLSAARLEAWLATQDAEVRDWVTSSGFRAEAHAVLRLPGRAPAFLIGLGEEADRWSLADLPHRLPAGDYVVDWQVEGGLEATLAGRLALGWALGAYSYDRYRAPKPASARLCWPEGADRHAVLRAARAVGLVRGLVTAPANDMGPEQLALAAEAVAKAHGAEVRIVTGEALLDQNYPLIHAVGRASDRAPRLVDLRWGDPAHPKVTLVGKGVCFDTGGLDLKQPGPMTWMKKDMGGAAHVIALAQMIMQAALPVRLRVLVPAVENAVSANAVRPMDVIAARDGTRVEIGNTDAEGRLVLADAIVEACSQAPDLLLDFATLTGAATVALGEDVPALFSNDEVLAADLLSAGERVSDPLWRLPLWTPYAAKLKSRIAELCSIDLAPTPAAGAILGGLFLQHFVRPGTPWAHIDIFAWNTEARPGRPPGGEAHGLLAAFDMVAARFGGDVGADRR